MLNTTKLFTLFNRGHSQTTFIDMACHRGGGYPCLIKWYTKRSKFIKQITWFMDVPIEDVGLPSPRSLKSLLHKDMKTDSNVDIFKSI